MIRPYPSADKYQGQNLDDLFTRAVEGDNAHAAIEASADITVTLAAANTAVDRAVAFSKPFAASPVVMVTLADAATPGTYITVIATGVTTTGFTLRAASGAAQTISVRWLAYGRRQ